METYTIYFKAPDARPGHDKMTDIFNFQAFMKYSRECHAKVMTAVHAAGFGGDSVGKGHLCANEAKMTLAAKEEVATFISTLPFIASVEKVEDAPDACAGKKGQKHCRRCGDKDGMKHD